MSETSNLKLFKHDNTSTNENSFDIEKALNDNWDKIDKAIGADREDIATNTENIQQNTDDIQTLNTENVVNTQNIQKNADDIEALKLEEVNIKRDISNNTTNINQNTADIITLKENVTEINEELTNKVEKVIGKGLSTNDYTTEEKNKLKELSNYDDTKVKENIATNTENINKNTTSIETLESDNTNIKENISTNAENIQKNVDSISSLEQSTSNTRNELERVKNDILETGEVSDTFIHLEDSAMAEFQELEIEGVCEQATTSVSNGDEYDSPSPGHKQPISVIEGTLNIISNNEKEETAEDYLCNKIVVNLGDEFIGKIDETSKDKLKVVYKEDGKYHLILNKMVGKVVLDGSEDWALSALGAGKFYVGGLIDYKMKSDTMGYAPLCTHFIGDDISQDFADGYIKLYYANNQKFIRLENDNTPTLSDFVTKLSSDNLEVYCPLEIPYEVDLGIVDMPISYDGITNLFTDSDLLPQINAKYYRNFKKNVQDLRTNIEKLKAENTALKSQIPTRTSKRRKHTLNRQC